MNQQKIYTWEAKKINGPNSNGVWGTPTNTHCIDNPETNTAMAELSEMVELLDAMDPRT